MIYQKGHLVGNNTVCHVSPPYENVNVYIQCDIAEILLKVALNTNKSLKSSSSRYNDHAFVVIWCSHCWYHCHFNSSTCTLQSEVYFKRSLVVFKTPLQHHTPGCYSVRYMVPCKSDNLHISNFICRKWTRVSQRQNIFWSCHFGMLTSRTSTEALRGSQVSPQVVMQIWTFIVIGCLIVTLVLFKKTSHYDLYSQRGIGRKCITKNMSIHRHLHVYIILSMVNFSKT